MSPSVVPVGAPTFTRRTTSDTSWVSNCDELPFPVDSPGVPPAREQYSWIARCLKLPTVMPFRVRSGLCDGKDVACRPGGRCEVPDPRRRGIQTEDSVAQRLPICSIQPEARCDPGCGVPSLWQGGPAFFPPLTRGLTCSRASETFPIWSEAPPVPPRPAGASHMRVICLRAIAVKSGGKEFIYVGGLSRRGRS
jgi:hypothetical protein